MHRPWMAGTLSWAVLFSLTGLALADGQAQTLKSARDGHPIVITYYSPPADKTPNGLQEAPVVVMLHGEGGSRLQWDKGTTLPNDLQGMGYAVITVDLRKHGESVIEGKKEMPVPADYEKMVLGDLAAVKEFIFNENNASRLNMNKMAIIASDTMSAVALRFTEGDWKQVPYDDSALAANRTPRGQDVRALVLISPNPNAGTIRSSSSMAFLKGASVDTALQVIIGVDDAEGLKEASKLYEVFTTLKPKLDKAQFIKVPGAKDHGMPLMLKYPNLRVDIVNFLDTHVKKAPNQWRDRRSRLDR